jgi:hypothetical protein
MSDHTSFLPAIPSPNSDDSRPLPELIADRYGFPLAYHDVEGVRYYAVQDWILGVAQTSEPRKFWDSLKRRMKKTGAELSSPCRQLPYLATDGKRYKMDHAKAETLYQITQRMDVNTGLRNQILEFLAKSGVVIDEIRIDPEQAMDTVIAMYKRMGRSDEWIARRIQSKIARNRFTGAFRVSQRVEPTPKHYAMITDEMRLGLWKRRTSDLRQQMGLKKDDNLRDYQSLLAMQYEMLTETISAKELEMNQDLTYEEAAKIVYDNGEDVGRHAAQTGQRLGIDIATDQPLLKKPKG